MKNTKQSAIYIPPQMEVYDILMENILCESKGTSVAEPWEIITEEEW
ncbi:MAG: hypothetical protein MJY83_04870 [Bacteroidales bacterium]|nr:hypothetical protein [Bacteroidales bacterium]